MDRFCHGRLSKIQEQGLLDLFNEKFSLKDVETTSLKRKKRNSRGKSPQSAQSYHNSVRPKFTQRNRIYLEVVR